MSHAALLAERARFHTTYRVTVRAFQAGVSLAERRSAPKIVTAALASAAVDLMIAQRLRRSSQFVFLPRLVLDAIDVSAWSLTHRGRYDAAVLAGVPLAFEGGIRLGMPKAIVVPLVEGAVTTFVRRTRRRPAELTSFVWQLLATLGGAGLAGYEDLDRRRAATRHATERAARLELAHLAGQGDIALGADSVVDLLSRTAPLLGEAGRNLPARLLAHWKATLATETASRASFLQTSLLRWSRVVNAQPDLSADVMFDLREGDGTLVLTDSQVLALERTLGALGLRGHVAVVTVGGDPLPGGEKRLEFNGETVVIPADPGQPRKAFDPGPLVLAAMAAWFLEASSPAHTNVRLRAVLPQSAAALVAVLGVHRRARIGLPVGREVLVLACMLALTHSVIATRSMPPTHSDRGTARFPSLDAACGLALGAALYNEEQSVSERVGYWSFVATVICKVPGGSRVGREQSRVDEPVGGLQLRC